MALAATLLLCAAKASAPTTGTSAQVDLLTVAPETASIHLAVECYPQALPNDGMSEAEVSVTLMADGEPLADRTVVAELSQGDGMLLYEEVTTSAEGIAVFPYRAGRAPETRELSFYVPETDAAASLSIPLAPVTYLDVLLVTPEEYAAYLSRQASAAPIYTLSLDVFPDQLAADGGSLATINAQLSHTDGTPAAGVPLTPQLISGEGSLMVEQVATDASGSFRFYFVAGFEPGTVTIQVLEPSTGLSEAVDILLVQAGPARVQMLYADPLGRGLNREGAILPADGITGLPIVAEVTDLLGVPLAGVELKVEVLDMAGGWIEVLDPVSDVAGHVEFVYHASTAPGQVRLRAFTASGLEWE